VSQRGHAIEVRIYAEDPQQNFLPSTGTVSHFVPPQGPGIRVDSGIESGDEISQFYDPMIAKLIVYGEDRAAAISRLRSALAHCAILGVTTNVPLLHAISLHPAFQQGLTFTSFLDEYGLLAPPSWRDLPVEVLQAAALYEMQSAMEGQATMPARPSTPGAPAANPWLWLGPWRMAGEMRTISYRYHDQDYRVALRPVVEAANTWRVQIDGQTTEDIACLPGNDGLLLLKRGPLQTQAYVQGQRNEIEVAFEGHSYRLQRRRPPDIKLASQEGGADNAQNALTAPMAGTIVKVQVHDGEMVQEHQTLLVLSAMKMEHSITAPYTGKVRHVHYDEGSVVAGGAVLVEME
jgi:3-methylcrotonyl-CoA carboxylase alpha subunit